MYCNAMQVEIEYNCTCDFMVMDSAKYQNKAYVHDMYHIHLRQEYFFDVKLKA